jgi:hypothetical protein
MYVCTHAMWQHHGDSVQRQFLVLVWSLSHGNTVSCTLVFFLFLSLFFSCNQNLQQHSSSELLIVTILDPTQQNVRWFLRSTLSIPGGSLFVRQLWSHLPLDARLQFRQTPETPKRQKTGIRQLQIQSPFARTLNPKPKTQNPRNLKPRMLEHKS